MLTPTSALTNTHCPRYADEARRKGWSSSAVADSLVSRLKDHFRADLAGRLLYPQERAQHKKLVAKSASDVCDVYGPEHLLRMFTTLPVRTHGKQLMRLFAPCAFSFFSPFFHA